MTSLLRITDGTTIIDLLEIKGWLLKNWRPAVPEPKGGGTFRSSPLTDGRKLVARPIGNVFDTFTIIGTERNQDMMIVSIQELQRLLEKATQYWTAEFQSEPVWIEARGQHESNIRYATIVDYRLTEFDNPYAQPFFSCSPASEIMLTIEHLPWQENAPGDDATCVQISSQYLVPTGYTDVSYNTDSEFDDAIVDTVNRTLVNGAATNIVIGQTTAVGLNPVREYAGWFENVAIPNGAQIVSAELQLTASLTLGADYLFTKVYGEIPLVGGTSDFNQTYTQYMARVWNTFIVENWAIPTTTQDDDYTVDITSLIQSIVDAEYWDSGDDIVLKVTPNIPCDEYRVFYSGDNAGVGQEPTLTIQYVSSSATAGDDETCENVVYIGNCHNSAPITHVFHYDTSGASFSGNLVGAATPFNLLPAAPTINDMIYFGCDTDYINYGPFRNVIFDIGTVSLGIVGSWEYWNGAWVNIDDSESFFDMCGNVQFIESGVTHIVFRSPEDWNWTTINGVQALWIRFHVEFVAAVPVIPTQGDGTIYTVLNPYVDIDEAQVGGDIPALSRIIYDLCNCVNYPTSKICIGLRSLDRGEDFSAYLNISDRQQPIGVSYDALEGTTYTAFEAPTGRNLLIADAHTSFEDVFYWELNSIANQYIGTYHAYLRVNQNTGTAGNVSLRAYSYTGGSADNYRYSDIGYTRVTSEAHAVDLGKMTIASPYRMRSDDLLKVLRIYIQIMNPNGEDVELYDLVLIPTDEWYGSFGNTENGIDGYRYDIDGATHPRATRASINEVIDDSSEYFYSDIIPVVSSVPILQSNKSQRLWFTQMYGENNTVNFETIGKVRLQRNNRYLFARGAR